MLQVASGEPALASLAETLPEGRAAELDSSFEAAEAGMAVDEVRGLQDEDLCVASSPHMNAWELRSRASPGVASPIPTAPACWAPAGWLLGQNTAPKHVAQGTPLELLAPRALALARRHCCRRLRRSWLASLRSRRSARPAPLTPPSQMSTPLCLSLPLMLPPRLTSRGRPPFRRPPRLRPQWRCPRTRPPSWRLQTRQWSWSLRPPRSPPLRWTSLQQTAPLAR